MAKKPDEFTIWLKEAVEKLDRKMEDGFKDTNKQFEDVNAHLSKLNGTIAAHTLSIAAINKWEETHCSEHIHDKDNKETTENVKYTSKMDLYKAIIISILGSGGLVSALLIYWPR